MLTLYSDIKLRMLTTGVRLDISIYSTNRVAVGIPVNADLEYYRQHLKFEVGPIRLVFARLVLTRWNDRSLRVMPARLR